NTLAPVIAQTSIRVLDMLSGDDSFRQRLWDNTRYFRQEMEKLGFELLPGETPIIPVMLGDAKLASEMADRLLAEGVYVIGFSFPVVPRGKARIRTQMSAGLEREHLDRAIAAFAKVGHEMNIID
ncbi:aminotransferase class I/II-fold pyridoxal phosphate-dependent enzyme, partial [Natronospira sp.]